MVTQQTSGWQSTAWRSQHKTWLKQSGYRCAVFPWIDLRKRYNIHHYFYHPDPLFDRYTKDYNPYSGKQKIGIHICAVSHEGHFLIHSILGGTLTMKEAVTKQNSFAKRFPPPIRTALKYPNPAQTVVHIWCRLPWWVKIYFVLPGLFLFWLAWMVGIIK